MSKKTTFIIPEANRSDEIHKSGVKATNSTANRSSGIAAFISDLKNGIYVVIVAQRSLSNVGSGR